MVLIRKEALSKKMVRNLEGVADVSDEDFAQLFSLVTKQGSEASRWILRSVLDDVLEVLSSKTEDSITEDELDITLEGVKNAIDSIDTHNNTLELFRKYVLECIRNVAHKNSEDWGVFRKGECISKFHLGGYFYRKDDIVSSDNRTTNSYLLKKYLSEQTAMKSIKEKKQHISKIMYEQNDVGSKNNEEEQCVDEHIINIEIESKPTNLEPSVETIPDAGYPFLNHLSAESKEYLEQHLFLHKVMPYDQGILYLNPLSLKNNLNLECSAEMRKLAMMFTSRLWDPFEHGKKIRPRERELRERFLENLYIDNIVDHVSSEDDKYDIGRLIYEKNHILLGHIKNLRMLFPSHAKEFVHPVRLSEYIGKIPLDIVTLLSEELAYEFFPLSASFNWHSPVSENNFFKDLMWMLLSRFFTLGNDLEQFLTLYLVDDFCSEEHPDQYECLNARNRRTLAKQISILREITRVMDSLIVDNLLSNRHHIPNFISKETITRVVKDTAGLLLAELQKREQPPIFFVNEVMDALLRIYHVS